ncbi:MAG: OmpH family outer membrane protein [Alphaproteobacteria bacterium]
MTRTGAALVLAAVALFTPAAWAEQKILVVDSDKLWEETAAGKDVKRQLSEFQAKLEKDISEAKSSLESEVSELNSQKERSIISDEDYQTKLKELSAKQQQLRGGLQQGQMLMQVATRNAQNQFYKAIRPSLLKIVEKRKGDLLIERSQTLYAAADHEITSEAIAAINKQFESLPVVLLPKREGEDAQAVKGQKKNN